MTQTRTKSCSNPPETTPTNFTDFGCEIVAQKGVRKFQKKLDKNRGHKKNSGEKGKTKRRQEGKGKK